MLGTVIGERYKILRRLGEGGMGEVFLAEHLGLARKEALKVLKSTIAVEPKYVARFRREARATNRVQHPNIVGIYDFGRLPDGRMFLAMEYAEGAPLRKVLNEAPLSVASAVSITKQLATAIEHAHGCGVIHRDIKPENLILCSQDGKTDILKVLDFGLAKIIHPDHAESFALTNQGDILGTALYMAPEQYQGKANDPRSDLYAMGCVFYEMLVGKPPFEGSMMALLHAHTSTIPARPSKRNPAANIPSAVEAIVLRCLEKNRDRRFQTGAEIVAALEAIPAASMDKEDASKKTIRIPKMLFDHNSSERSQTGWSGHSTFATYQMGCAQTEMASLEDLIQGWRELLKELACRLQDAHLDSDHTGQLSVAIARAVALDDDVARTRSEQETVSSQSQRLDQSTRERMASLRFAVGELQFDRQQLEADARGEIDFQISELNKRLLTLSKEADEKGEELLQRGVSLAAATHELGKRRGTAYHQLETLVDSLVPAYENSTELGPLVDQYKSTRSGIERLQSTPDSSSGH